MAQLVGRRCAQCGDHIPNELDSQFCPLCGSPVHLRCMEPQGGLGCPACGVLGVLPPTAETPVPLPSSQRPAAWPRHLRVFLGVYYTLAIVWGCRQVYWWKPSFLDFLVPATLVLTLGWWAVADARARRRPLPLLSHSWFFQAGIPLAPGYFITTRGWRGLGWVILHLFLGCVVVFVTMTIGGVMIFGTYG